MNEATIYIGDALDTLRTLPDASVHTCVTSPPYFGLRDYGHDGQVGLETTPAEYVAGMVAVFEDVRRVLRDDGTCWLNLGDSYAAGGNGTSKAYQEMRGTATALAQALPPKKAPPGLKPKDLVGIPWRLAFALQDAGWYLRSDIIWHKPNPMPESVTDRPTKAHEYVFLLTKSARYYYDNEAVKEDSVGCGGGGFSQKYAEQQPEHGAMKPERPEETGKRNRRSVWTVTTKPFPGAHFAVYPPELIEPCVLAGTSERGCCPECGSPWERVTERVKGEAASHKGSTFTRGKTALHQLERAGEAERTARVETTGWEPTCDCPPVDPVPCNVLDPFNGAGTTGLVALAKGRDYVGIELNPEYAHMAAERIRQAAPMFNRVEVISAKRDAA